MQTKRTELYTSILITYVVAFLSLIMRLVARRIKKARLWWDDYMSISSFILATGFTALSLWWMSLGLGRHLWDIPQSKELIFYNSNRALWIADLLYASSLASSKMSILLFYWRLFGTTSIRIPIRVLFGCVVTWLVIRLILTTIHCIPPKAYWDKSIKNAVCPINPSHFFFGTVTVHLILDVIIIALPAFEVRKLNLPLLQKIGISAMFASGIFVCCASILQLISSFSYDPFSDDVAWNITPVVIWASVEVNLSIMSTCLPMLRTVYPGLIRRRRTPSIVYPDSDRAYSSYKRSDRSRRRKHLEWLSGLTGFTQTGRMYDSESTHQLQSTVSRSREGGDGGDGNSHRTGSQDGKVVSSVAANGVDGWSERQQQGGIEVRKEVDVRVSEAK